ncbi:DNA primase [Streptomyces lydicus]|uniref:DNA primase n=1 Tax=Streptomyces lydicus TaxID=47763 RepID=UPI0013E95498|nr:DNA primase [Streptomyces lydicus]MCZ1012040.1 DNA primase [Streptomyces lydicus]
MTVPPQVPGGGRSPARRRSPAPELPTVLPGEDRGFGQSLFVDLVPRSCWFTNVRSCVARKDWDRLRRMIYGRADNRCEVCGATPGASGKPRLEAHERWDFDEATRTQTLKRLICLCSNCHMVTHFGFAQVRGLEGRAFAHLLKVTGMTERQGRQHVQSAFLTWQQRSTHRWELDLSILTTAGITLAPPPSANDRAVTAEQTLKSRTGMRSSEQHS